MYLLSSCVVGADAISISDSNIHHSIQQQHLPGVCIYLSLHQSPARGGVSPPGVAMGEEAASGKEKIEETRQLMILVPAQARTINSNTVFNVFSVTHQHNTTII